MGLFDIFTGDPYKESAQKQQQYLQGVTDNIMRSVGATQAQGLDALRSGQMGATQAVQGGIGQARTDINQFSPQALQFLLSQAGSGRADLIGAQGGALDALRSGVQGATSAFDPLAAAAGRYGAAGQQASQASADALGLNGPEGVARAQSSFQAGPGYQFALDQGLESLLRNAGASGMAASGNQLVDAQKFGIGQANQEFDKYRSALAGREGLYAPLESNALGTVGQGRSAAELTGGTGAANIITGTGSRLADLSSSTGARGADIIRGQGTSLADLAARGGLAESGIAQTGGQNIADLLKSLQQMSSTAQTTIAPTYSKSFDTAAAGQMGGSQNLWNLIGGLASFGAGTGTGSSLLKSI